MVLIAYEHLTDHGFALPLFATSPTSNALHVALPSVPGDPVAHIRDFQLYSPAQIQTLDVAQFRPATQGDSWIDVFIWHDKAHIGTRSELWESTKAYRDEMERIAPLSLSALADGVDRSEATRYAAVAYEWLARSWGASRADRWRVDSYLTRLARRDFFRRYGAEDRESKAFEILRDMHLVQRHEVLEVRVLRLLDFNAEDLSDLTFATNALGWRLEIIPRDIGDPPSQADSVKSGRSMVMRLRHGRGRTQTQIPLRVVDLFFSGNRNLQDERTGRLRSMTLSKAGEERNTMKLQLPEIAKMTDPVARFERRDDRIIFAVHDSSSPEGRKITELLNEGVRDGSTRKTQRGATWWRVLP